MKFSLLMATKNRPLMAIKAIEAVILQNDTFYNWELVVNDGSEHDLHPALFRFPDPRIKWHHDAGRTFIEACNEMLQRATGDIFCFVNDDDVMIPGALRYVADNIGDAKWLVGRMLYEDAPYGHAGTLEELMAGNYIPQPAVFWTRDAYDTIGGFDSHLWLAEDYDYWLRLWKAFGPPKFVDGIITAYGVHPGQMTQVHQHEQCLAAQRVRDKHG